MAKKRKRRSKRRKQSKRNFRILKPLLLFSLFCIASLAALYFYVGYRVSHSLKLRESGLTPAVYTTTTTLKAGEYLSKSNTMQQLSNRRYLEVPDEPAKPGEFSIKGENLKLITRRFLTPNGKLIKPQFVDVNFSTGEIHSKEKKKLNIFHLEPRILTKLGSKVVKTSEAVPFSKIPKHLTNAVLTIEDQRFYSHFGIDLVGISRAMIANIKAGKIVQGGSTLTQQLAKNMFFSPEKTIWRKVLDALAAINLEQKFSKDKILQLYLNEVYLGQEGVVAVHGVSQASRTFFGKPVTEINLAQSALLAGLIRAPSYYAPRRHPKRAKARRDTVLSRMRETKVITQAQYTNAVKQSINVIKEKVHKRRTPHFINALKRNLNEDMNLDAALLSGVRIYTGIDLSMQQCAERALVSGLNTIEKERPALARKLKAKKQKLEGGLVSLEPYSGLIKAWVGSRDYSKNQFDHVNQGERQVGSTIKPFLYLTALDGNLNTYKVATPASHLSDRPVTIDIPGGKSWSPQNFDEKFRGDVTLRYALEQSLNVPAVYVVRRVGVPAMAKTLERVSLSDSIERVMSLSLGALDTTLLRLTAAYGALANGGIYTSPRFFISALDQDHNTLATSKIEEERVSPEDVVYVLNNMLQGVIQRGTGKRVRALGYNHPAAGKTGTSSDRRDAWFVGFTPELVTGVWVGADDNSITGLTGGTAAAPIWTEYMKCSSAFLPTSNFIRPQGVSYVKLDRLTGDRAVPNCPDEYVVTEIFVEGTEPRRPCRKHSPQDLWDEEQPTLDEEYDSKPSKPKRRKGLWEILFGD